ncbi:TetR/AcrR family transcriptional regulator [Streptomyces bathyalis]|uniref:TetR/AcrR family transcriptional regulator n=1 Tax=Streptomyces bathyalis TaxID=2710756 RepID=A0A7T1T9Q4_9ACTN|nr:TetR family transcriptional regulator C-terminal domain-containing protein [Streptomyces bathyalis]QPP09017.1 TetR/AcrR family transcriptional regulator [Streptomyces bathyalis]
MPKQVDHDARRTAIAQALWRVARVRGLERVSLREVATEAEMSLGQLQHYFANRQDLMKFAMEFMSRKNVERVTERLITVGGTEHTARLRAIVMEMLPIDEDARVGSLLNIDFLLEAARNDDLRDHVKQRTAALRGLLEGQIALAVQAGDISADRDARTEAALLIGLADGLRTHFHLGTHTADEVVSLMEQHLARLFGGPGEEKRR